MQVSADRKKKQEMFDFWEGFELALAGSLPDSDRNDLFWIGWGRGAGEREGWFRPGVPGEVPYASQVS
jgi:hypothetical protein